MLRRISQILPNYTQVMTKIKISTSSFFPYNFVIFDNNKKVQLGRWGNHCDQKTNIKADYSNVDHCGPCGLDKIKNIK
jgi:hypothetical protein